MALVGFKFDMNMDGALEHQVTKHGYFLSSAGEEVELSEDNKDQIHTIENYEYAIKRDLNANCFNSIDAHVTNVKVINLVSHYGAEFEVEGQDWEEILKAVFVFLMNEETFEKYKDTLLDTHLTHLTK